MGWWNKYRSRHWHHKGWTEGYRQACRELGFGDVNASPPRPLSSEITDAHLDGFRRGKEYARSPLHDNECRLEGFREGVEKGREMQSAQNAQPPGNGECQEMRHARNDLKNRYEELHKAHENLCKSYQDLAEQCAQLQQLSSNERGYYKIGVSEGIMDILDTLRAELHSKEEENAEMTRRGGRQMEVYPEKFLDGLRYAEYLIEKARDNRND